MAFPGCLPLRYVQWAKGQAHPIFETVGGYASFAIALCAVVHSTLLRLEEVVNANAYRNNAEICNASQSESYQTPVQLKFLISNYELMSNGEICIVGGPAVERDEYSTGFLQSKHKDVSRVVQGARHSWKYR